MRDPSPLTELHGITKLFPGIIACDRVDLRVYPGEIHALLGENGAGKTTLMHVLYGLHQPDAGEIWIDGQRRVIRSPRDAIRAGIGMVFQHFTLMPSLTVYFSTPFLPLLVGELGITDPRAVAIWSGVLIALGPASAAIASPLWGRLADRFGGRLLLVRTVFGFALINLLCAVSTSVWQLGLLRLLMGTLGGFTAVALALASLSTPPEYLTRAIAMAQSTQILGLMVGPALGGLLADHFGIRAAFVGSSGLAVIAGLNMLLVYHEPRSSTAQRQVRPKVSLRALLQTPGFVPILIVLFAGSFTDRSYQPLIPLFVAFLVPVDGAVASLTGLIVASGAMAAALSANAASHLVPRFTHAQVLWWALVVCIGGSALMAYSHTAWQLGLLRVAVGLFAGCILTLAYGLGGTVVPIEQRSSAFGALNSGAMVGSAMGPFMAGILAAVSLRGAFLFNTGIFCIGLLAVWRGLSVRRQPS